MTDISREATEGVCNRIHESKAGVHVRVEAQIITRALRAALDHAEADKAAVEDHTAIIAVLKTKIAEADRLAFVLSIAIGMLAVLVVL